MKRKRKSNMWIIAKIAAFILVTYGSIGLIQFN
jgi:hypothetical protein